jgi:hypothetical protein
MTAIHVFGGIHISRRDARHKTGMTIQSNLIPL